ncbi:MAG: UDP-N-acetylmuramoyl-L-alanine--D-glutamate ligase [Clostridiales bacterium]|nr:UDP-N-acetylmuramoyl-L-alanine--D-glutamate ligase [Clostridiales bacterium]
MTALDQYLESISNQRVAVIGAGVSNVPLIRILRDAGIAVTVHDKKDAAALGAQYESLAALGVSFSLGEGYLNDLTENIVFRTPGLHPDHPALKSVRACGGTVTSEMELFFAVCPCPIIGITGSDGKTTTTTLTYEFLKHAGHTCHLGGNIGKPLLPEVREMQPDDLAIVELSSFQLMGMQYSPSVAAITNLTPNHLDYHKDFDEYVQAKTSIFTHQKPGGKLVLCADDPVTRRLDIPGAHEIWHCTKQVKPETGVYLRDGVIYIAENGQDRALMEAKDIRIPGAHNVYNVMMAAAIVQGLCEDSDIVAVATTFAGVEHRIEFVREFEGVKYYNDSIASSPTRTIAGLNSFDQKLILIAGGYDKHIPYDVLGEPICDHVKTLILTGATAPKIRQCVEQTGRYDQPQIIDVPDLKSAVRTAYATAHPGDIVIMSPASASFDCFKNFMERGELFKQFVNALD